MIDDEIIKTLEYCFYNSTCKECPCYKQGYSCSGLDGDVLRIINHQKAENLRLFKENERYAELERGCYVTGYKNIRAEAIKDFAERLMVEGKENILKYTSEGGGSNFKIGTLYAYYAMKEVVDKLVKEMTEG